MADGCHLSAFRRRVLDAVARIPAGRVTTYKLLGDHIGCRCYRAIGQALRYNPFAPGVPCHRVIASDLRIGGFAGERAGAAVQRKQRLLRAEGVRFQNGRLADPNRMFAFSCRQETRHR
jgi:methylated-DNA-[protein]-cysteine S-methyltransferase